MKCIFFDLETDGLGQNSQIVEYCCKLVQVNEEGEIEILEEDTNTVRVPKVSNSAWIFKNSTLTPNDLLTGCKPAEVTQILAKFFEKADVVVGYNLAFDMKRGKTIPQKPMIDLMLVYTKICKIPRYTITDESLQYQQEYKWPKLEEAIKELDNVYINAYLRNPHRAFTDVDACIALFKHAIDSGYLNREDFK